MVPDKWAKTGIIATLLCAGFSAWQVYRGEHPITGAASATPSTSWGVAITFLVSSTILLLAVWLAFIPKPRKRKHLKLVIHSATYGIGKSADVDATDIVKVYIVDNRLAFFAANQTLCLKDPYPNQWKHFTIDYSYGPIRRTSRFGENYAVRLPEDDVYSLAQESSGRVAV